MRSTRGASLVEYILLVGLIAIVALVGFLRFGATANAKIDQHAQRVAALDGGYGSGTAGSHDATSPDGADAGNGGDSDGGGGGLWGAIKGVGSGLVNGAKAVGGGLWDGAKATVGFGWDFAKGLYKGVQHTVFGIRDIVLHPIKTLQGLNYAIHHPLETLWLIGAEYVHEVQENGWGQGLGFATVDVLLTVGTHGVGAGAKAGVSVASKSAKARNVIRATNRGDDTAMVAQSQHMVEEAGAAPSWVRTADTILTRATMPSSWFYSPSPPNFDHGHGDEGHEGEGHEGEDHEGEGHEGEGHEGEGHEGEGHEGEEHHHDD